ncbi:leucine-rich repeat receptor-like serine/threonine-protein kinase At2g14510 [Cryptomeria japonica]|uniref:leucine-rich repeat receptor-like serine/threonine-protein kinase At2g14510 n=1 Tax=Cryptomeria japonica TaxID=3369 RepID=UPI0027D9DA1A|nr:leucine-rich repeat receptor-like serine/threonine-protein kinase At2g14510 [Cryptomeria japonica]
MARHCKQCLGNKQTMEVIDSSKYVGVVSLFLFLLSCTLFKAANAQPEGFVSIDCGGERNRTDLDTNITWVTDDHYLHNNLGVKAESYYNYALRHFYLGSLLVFPKPVKKACYELPLTPNVPHLLRVSFVDANSTGSRGFNYSIETSDMLYMENVIPYYCLVCRSEHILVSTDKVVHICLIRTSECDDPFISAIELRPLQKGMYKRAKPGTMLNLIERDDMGDAYEVTRYPQDKFDRRWIPWLPDGTCSVNASDRVSVSSNTNFPPLNVMQTAVVSNTSNSNRIYFTLGTYDTGNSILLLYFANLNLTETNLFSVGINNAIQNQSIPLKDFSALELEFEFNGTRGATMILESNTPNQSPIINAVEIYSLVLTKPATSLDDGQCPISFLI